MSIDDIYEIYDSAERQWLVDNCEAVRALMSNLPVAKAPATEQPVREPVPDDGPFPPWMLDQFTGCGIDQLDTAKTYNLTGTHLKQILKSYCQLYEQRLPERESSERWLKEASAWFEQLLNGNDELTDAGTLEPEHAHSNAYLIERVRSALRGEDFHEFDAKKTG